MAMLRLFTAPLGDGEEQQYNWDSLTWDDNGVAANIDLGESWSLQRVRLFYGHNYPQHMLVVKAVGGQFKGICLQWMDHPADEQPDDEYVPDDELIKPTWLYEGGGPMGRFTLVLTECVDGCHNMNLCNHLTDDLWRVVTALSQRLHNILAVQDD